MIKEKNLLVICGNPPYSNKTTKNVYDISAYKNIDGVPIKEKNFLNLSDDYVKFIRFAQEKMDSQEAGVIGIVTNNGFLENITFYGMRYSLMRSFDQILILDLNGNGRKRARENNQEKDENVFGILTGVCIVFFIKKPGLKKGIFRRDIFGTREHKYQFLLDHNCSDIEKEEYRINPRGERIPFKNSYFGRNYEEVFWYIKDIFMESDTGIATFKDKLVIGRNENIFFERLSNFSRLSEQEARKQYNLEIDSRNWKLLNAQKDIIFDLKRGYVKKILYRPFDMRYIYYKEHIKSKGIIAFPRYNIMKHIKKNNCALILMKQYDYVCITDKLLDLNYMSGGAYLFPLYLYNEDLTGAITKTVNFTDEFQKFIKEKYNDIFNELDIFFYIYGVLNSSFYKNKYADYLKQDFARILFTDDIDLFRELSRLGKQLAKMHMLQEIPHISVGDFKEQAAGDNLINRLCYKDERGYINENKYFDNVTQAVWDYTVGHNRVIKHYLDSRKKNNFGESSELTLEEITHLEKVIKILTTTIEILPQVDEIYKKIETRLI